MKIGFDNDKYLSMQSEHIRQRINQFDNKLYLEFGGKLFDDYHASRVLPGFAPDSKLRMLMQLSDHAEIVIVISAGDIEKNKVRGDLGITYDIDVPPPDATEKYFLPFSLHSFLYVPATGCWKRVGFVELPVIETSTPSFHMIATPSGTLFAP